MGTKPVTAKMHSIPFFGGRTQIKKEGEGPNFNSYAKEKSRRRRGNCSSAKARPKRREREKEGKWNFGGQRRFCLAEKELKLHAPDAKPQISIKELNLGYWWWLTVFFLLFSHQGARPLCSYSTGSWDHPFCYLRFCHASLEHCLMVLVASRPPIPPPCALNVYIFDVALRTLLHTALQQHRQPGVVKAWKGRGRNTTGGFCMGNSVDDGNVVSAYTHGLHERGPAITQRCSARTHWTRAWKNPHSPLSFLLKKPFGIDLCWFRSSAASQEVGILNPITGRIRKPDIAKDRSKYSSCTFKQKGKLCI